MNKKENRVCLIALVETIVIMALIFLWCTASSNTKVAVEAKDEDIVYAKSLPVHTETPKTALEPTPEPTAEPYIPLGVCRITAYCDCSECCGKSDGITASGTQATEGRTIAVDPNVIPYGTEVVINGHTYIAEDCGGAIDDNEIDIFMESHEKALIHGVQYAEVFVKNE